MLGFALSESMEQDIKELSLTVPIPELSTRTMLVISEMTELAVVLNECLAARPSRDTAIEIIQDLHPWTMEHAVTGAVPAKVMERITQWIA